MLLRWLRRSLVAASVLAMMACLWLTVRSYYVAYIIEYVDENLTTATNDAKLYWFRQHGWIASRGSFGYRYEKLESRHLPGSIWPSSGWYWRMVEPMSPSEPDNSIVWTRYFGVAFSSTDRTTEALVFVPIPAVMIVLSIFPLHQFLRHIRARRQRRGFAIEPQREGHAPVEHRADGADHIAHLKA